jgi:hypothetical protein
VRTVSGLYVLLQPGLWNRVKIEHDGLLQVLCVLSLSPSIFFRLSRRLDSSVGTKGKLDRLGTRRARPLLSFANNTIPTSCLHTLVCESFVRESPPRLLLVTCLWLLCRASVLDETNAGHPVRRATGPFVAKSHHWICWSTLSTLHLSLIHFWIRCHVAEWLLTCPLVDLEKHVFQSCFWCLYFLMANVQTLQIPFFCCFAGPDTQLFVCLVSNNYWVLCP